MLLIIKCVFISSKTFVWNIYHSKKNRARYDQNVYWYSYVEIKCQLDATEVFIAGLIVCSTRFGHHYAHHQELKSIIQWLLPVVFGAVVFKLLLWCGAEGYVSGLQDNLKTTAPNTTGINHRIILLSSWWWAYWCPKHVEQAIRSAIKTSVASSWHFISTY